MSQGGSQLQTIEGQITEIGPSSTHPLGRKHDYVRLTDSRGEVHEIPGLVVLDPLASKFKEGSNLRLSYGVRCFSKVLFGIEAAGARTCANNLGVAQIGAYAGMFLMGVALMLTLITFGMGLIFAWIPGLFGWYLYSSCQPPTLSQIEASLSQPSLAPGVRP